MKWMVTVSPSNLSTSTLSEHLLDLEELAQLFSEYEDGDKEGSCFLPAHLDTCSAGRCYSRKPSVCRGGPHRIDENVRKISCLVLDVDHAPVRPTSAFFHFWYETHSSTPEAPRYRFIFPLAEPYAISRPEDWRKNAWPKLVKAVGFKGLVDVKCSNPSRIYYPPRKPVGSVRASGRVEGQLLDWRSLVIPRAAPEPSQRVPAPIPEGATDLNKIRTQLGSLGGSEYEEIGQCLLAGIALTPAPENRQPGDLGRRGAWQKATALLSMIADDGTPPECLWPIMQGSFEAMVAEDPDGFEPEARRQDIEGLLRGALASAPGYKKTKAERQARELAALGGIVGPKGVTAGIEGEVSPDHDNQWAIEGLSWKTDKEGNPTVPKSTGANITTILTHDPQWRGALKFNLLTCKPEIHSGPVVDGPPREIEDYGDPVYTANWLERAWKIEVNNRQVIAYMLAVCWKQRFDPLMEYLNGLVWDGVPRLRTAFRDYFGAVESPVREIFSEKFFIGAVARGLDPGCQLDTMLVLEGEIEGEGKTSALRILGGEFFSGAPINVHDKESRMLTAKNWLCEVGELDTFGRHEETALKDFVTRREEDVRRAYGYFDKRWKRRCTLVGTTNKTDWAQGIGRKRRFWPINCKEVDRKALARDRDQLWAEAVAKYKAGIAAETDYLWWLSPEESTLADSEIQKREPGDLVADKIESDILKKMPAERPRNVRILDLLFSLDMTAGDRGVEMLVGHALRRLGFKRKRAQIEGTRSYHYETPQRLLDAPQIKDTKALERLIAQAHLQKIDGGA